MDRMMVAMPSHWSLDFEPAASVRLGSSLKTSFKPSQQICIYPDYPLKVLQRQSIIRIHTCRLEDFIHHLLNRILRHCFHDGPYLVLLRVENRARETEG